MYVPPSLAKQTENGNLKQGGDGRAIAAICDHTCTLVKTLGTLRKLVTVVYCTPHTVLGVALVMGLPPSGVRRTPSRGVDARGEA